MKGEEAQTTSHHRKMNWGNHRLKSKAKTLKLLGENIGKYLHNQWVDGYFFSQTQQATVIKGKN